MISNKPFCRENMYVLGVSYWQLTGSISGTVTLDDGAIRHNDKVLLHNYLGFILLIR